jgi:hypothetical protein
MFHQLHGEVQYISSPTHAARASILEEYGYGSSKMTMSSLKNRTPLEKQAKIATSQSCA